MFVKKLLKVGLIGVIAMNTLFADTVRIDRKHVNVRSGAGSNYKVIGKVQQGAGYHFLRTDGEWVKISFKNSNGWVHHSLVDIERDRAEVSSGGCIESEIASWTPTALNLGCCAVTLGWGCVACTVVLTGGEIVAGDSIDRALEGALCD